MQLWPGSRGDLARGGRGGGQKKGLASPSGKTARGASSVTGRACADEEGAQFWFSADALSSVAETVAGSARAQE